MKLSNSLSLLIALLCIAGCVKQNIFKLDNKFKDKEAKLFDVPLPLNYAVLDNKYGPDSYGFKTSSSCSEILDFYKEEMINAGWKLVSVFYDIETNLLFEKPHKFILISIRPHLSKTSCQVHIFVTLKKAS